MTLTHQVLLLRGLKSSFPHCAARGWVLPKIAYPRRRLDFCIATAGAESSG